MGRCLSCLSTICNINGDQHGKYNLKSIRYGRYGEPTLLALCRLFYQWQGDEGCLRNCVVTRGADNNVITMTLSRSSGWHQCTVKHHTDIINFACMTWNFVRISASLSALCTNINQICHWHCISCKILPNFDVWTISVFMDPQIASLCNDMCCAMCDISITVLVLVCWIWWTN